VHLCYLGKRTSSNGEYLTDAELRYWSEHFKIPEDVMPQMPVSEYLFVKCKEVDRSLNFLKILTV
jgi:hypothetical protein